MYYVIEEGRKRYLCSFSFSELLDTYVTGLEKCNNFICLKYDFLILWGVNRVLSSPHTCVHTHVDTLTQSG